MKQRILLILAIIFLILSAGLFYVNKVLLPVQIKGMIIKALSEQTGRKVSLATLQWSPVQGAMITDLIVYDKEKPTDIFLHIPSASAQILIFPFFHKKIIIPSMKINGLSLCLVKTGQTIWNFSDLMKPSAPTTNNNSMPDIIVSSFAFTQARIKLVDLSSGDEFSDNIDPLNFKGSLSLADGLHIFGEMAIPSSTGTIKFDTRLGLRDNTFKGDFKITNIDLARYVRFMPESLPVTVNNATLKTAEINVSTAENNITIAGSVTFPGLDLMLEKNRRVKTDLILNKFSLSSKGNTLLLQGNITGQKTEASFDSQIIQGDLHANIQALSLENGQINATTDVDIRNFSAILTGDQKLQGNISLSSFKIAQNDKGLTTSADIHVENMAIQTSQGQIISGDLSLVKAQAQIEKEKMKFLSQLRIEKLKIKSGDILYSGDITSPDLVVLQNNAIDVNMTAKMSNTQINLPQGLTFSGNSTAAIHLRLENKALSYDGSLDLADNAIKNLPVIDAAKEINGKILFETEKVSTKDLSFKVFDTSVGVSGEITNFAHPMLNVDAAAKNVNLSLAERLIPQLFKEQGLKIAGQANITAHIEGEAAKIDQAKIIATADISGASIESSKLKQNLDNISGTVTYTPPSLSWKTLSLDFQKQTYVFNGHLQDFSNPTIVTSIKGADMVADIQAKKIGDNIHVESLTASLFDSSVSAKGRIDIPTGQPPLINITADGKIAIRDIPKILPQYEKNITDLKLSGVLKIKAVIKGPAMDWQNWNADIAVTTPSLSCMGYTINNLNITALEKNGTLAPLEIKGILYDGNLGIISTVGLIETGIPFDTTFKLQQTNLELLKRDIPALQQNQFSGFLTLSGELKGKALDWKNMTGRSNVEIANGYLWEFPILTKILGILSTSFQGGDVIITDASATLDINEGRISTNTLTLKSIAVSLLGEGWIDFDQNINLNITPRLEPKTGTTDNSIEPINPTAGLLNLHVTGTLQKPKIESNLSAPTVIQKTLQNTVGNLLKIFE
ncbi:MAG: AsmA family protein [Candidatus Omnitrophica bacterium]|nr:AsmA family protein [Candidatus Omnitrophota bacterium]